LLPSRRHEHTASLLVLFTPGSSDLAILGQISWLLVNLLTQISISLPNRFIVMAKKKR
jgi:hypothetical protein